MVRFKMIGRDIDAFPAQYRTWIVEDQPDLTGALYTGDKSGPNPLFNIRSYAIYDNSVVADFNLPEPLSWDTTKCVLPKSLPGSHLAIIDGYVYLFGGQNTDKIFRATLDNPTIWEDTGSTLPTPLYGGQLSIVDGYVYIFGGNNGSATDTVYSATTDDPLTWTNNGSRLPRKLFYSQVAIVDGYLYLYGGIDGYAATDVIFTASTGDPLTWTDTSDRLPIPLANSQVAIMNNNVVLLGGITTGNQAVPSIFQAPTVFPTLFVPLGNLPYPVYGGQFFTVGNKGYLATQTAGATIPRASFTKILRCNLSSPDLWVDTQRTIPGQLTQSQFAIIYDRLYLFGGSGNTAIFANNYQVKYRLNSVQSVTYGVITRTQYNTTPNQLDLFEVIGFPPWKTSFGV